MAILTFRHVFSVVPDAVVNRVLLQLKGSPLKRVRVTMAAICSGGNGVIAVRSKAAVGNDATPPTASTPDTPKGCNKTVCLEDITQTPVAVCSSYALTPTVPTIPADADMFAFGYEESPVAGSGQELIRGRFLYLPTATDCFHIIRLPATAGAVTGVFEWQEDTAPDPNPR